MQLAWILALIGLQSVLFVYCRRDKEMQRTSLKDNKWSIYYEFLKTFETISSEKNECKKKIQKIFSGINQGDVWAIKALDASGSFKTSFIYHNNFWHGSKLACHLLNKNEKPWTTAAYNIEVVRARAPFDMKYFTVFANYSTTNQFPQFTHIYIPLQLGICAPEVCSKNQILQAIGSVLEGGELPFHQLYNVTFEVLTVRTERLINFFTRKYTIISLFGLVTVLALVFGINLYQTDEENTWGRFSSCFSLRKNIQELLSTTRQKGSIECLDGIRSIACIWIMVTHLLYFSFFVYENAAEILFMIKDIRIMVLYIATYILDAFFVISALLLTYNFLNNEHQKNTISCNGFITNFILFVKLCLHRYIRLTPAVLLTMILSHLSAVYMKEATHFYVPESLDNSCPTYSWWRGILYVQNFYPMEKMCGFWTWYLACEMLYFLISLLGLFMYIKSPNKTKIYFFSLLGFSIIYSFYVNYSEHYDFGLDRFYHTLNTIYKAPLVRINPYLVGIIGGRYLHSAKDVPIKVNYLLKIIGTSTEILGISFLIIATKYFESIPGFFMQAANSIGRFIFSVFLTRTIVLLTIENNGILKTVLCSRIFAHFNKLSYMMYLLQPILVYIYRAGSNSSVRVDIFNIYIEALGILVLCYFVSFIATLFFEIPYYRLSTKYLKIVENKKDVKNL